MRMKDSSTGGIQSIAVSLGHAGLPARSSDRNRYGTSSMKMMIGAATIAVKPERLGATADRREHAYWSQSAGVTGEREVLTTTFPAATSMQSPRRASACRLAVCTLSATGAKFSNRSGVVRRSAVVFSRRCDRRLHVTAERPLAGLGCRSMWTTASPLSADAGCRSTAISRLVRGGSYRASASGRRIERQLTAQTRVYAGLNARPCGCALFGL